jgi:hypothetical protein
MADEIVRRECNAKIYFAIKSAAKTSCTIQHENQAASLRIKMGQEMKINCKLKSL